MEFNTNHLKEAVALLEGCASGRVTIEEFAETYFHLTEGDFSVASQLPSTCTDKEGIEELFSALRSDCAQFQPNPELFAELMKTAAYPDEFLNQEGLRIRVDDALAKLRQAGIGESRT